MIIDCSLSQDLANENEIWIMDFEFELSEEERTKEVRDNIHELYTIITKFLNKGAAC
jgi:hypothetical protein